MRLLSPEVADGVNAKCRVKNGKRSPYASQKKASNSTDPSTVKKPYQKRQGQPGKHNRNIVPVLPHDDAVLPQARGIFFVGPRVVVKQPSAVAIPKPPLRIIGIHILVA